MSEQWAIMHPDAPLDERANFGVGCSRKVYDPDCPRGMAFIVNPDHLVTTDLRTGETMTYRERYAADDA